MVERIRYALVGTGARAEMYLRALAVDHADRAELAALVDVNPVRMAAHNELLAEVGAGQVPTYRPEHFSLALKRERVDTVIVASVDRTHDDYIVDALEHGCSAITEKPMTVDVPGCRRVLEAARRTDRDVTVTFNYRYNPIHEKIRELLADGVIGEVGSVHFEWLLDVRHGADYFRRWHRDKSASGGLLVHKSGHHFDLVNWWLGATPTDVFAQGRLFFYGDEAGNRHGYARDYERAHGSPAAQDDPFALRLTDNPRLSRLYLDAEHVDGYLRDRNVFAPGITIEDDMAVLVRYSTGATMTYHLTAYAPWEGYRIAFNGSAGRLEVEVVESDFVAPGATGAVKGAALHGVDAAVEDGWVRLLVRPYWKRPEVIEVPGHTRGGHGGADARMLAAILAGDGRADRLGRTATERDGAMALLTGLAANRSLETGRPVAVTDLVDLTS